MGGSCFYLRMRHRVGEEPDASVFIARSEQPAGSRGAARHYLGAIVSFGQDAEAGEGERARTRGPIEISHERHLRDRAAQARVPCSRTRKSLTSTMARDTFARLQKSSSKSPAFERRCTPSRLQSTCVTQDEWPCAHKKKRCLVHHCCVDAKTYHTAPDPVVFAMIIHHLIDVDHVVA